jgi:imidazole glycerol-phosphate synthase subunit HisH
MISIVNYGLGNIKAIQNVYSKLNIPAKVVSNSNELKGSKKIILPGVGAFDFAMEKLKNSGMFDDLNELVVNQEIPVIGICVGLQMMTKSSEAGGVPVLGWIDAVVKKFDTSKMNDKILLPHMGWNDVKPIIENPLFDDLMDNSKFYFLHSYYVECNNEKHAIASSNYGNDFACAINHNNIYGVQFHPEKSHFYGVKILENFAKI